MMKAVSRWASISAAVCAVAALAVAPSSAQAAPNCDQPDFALINGSFELPEVMVNGNNYAEVLQADMPGWITEDQFGKFELWGPDFFTESPTDGVAFLEVQYAETKLIYQDVASTPGESLTVTMDHWSRYPNVIDHLLIKMGPVGGPFETVLDMNDSHTPTSHSGVYVVPNGQLVTRFLIDPVTTGAGASHIDNIVVTPTECLGAVAYDTRSSVQMPNTGFDFEPWLWGAFALLSAGFILRRKRVTPATTARQREGQRTFR